MPSFESAPSANQKEQVQKPSQLDGAYNRFRQAELINKAGQLTEDEAKELEMYTFWGNNSEGFNLQLKESAGAITKEDAAKLAGLKEFKNLFADQEEKGLVQKEFLGTISENERKALAIARTRKAEKRDYTDEELAEFDRLRAKE